MLSIFKKTHTKPKIERLGALLSDATSQKSGDSAKRRKKHLKNMMDIAAGEHSEHYADMIAKGSYGAVLIVQSKQDIFKAAQLAGDLFSYAKEITAKTGDRTIEDALKKENPVFEGLVAS